MTLVVVQEVIVTWTKRARGGKAAAWRNAVPEAFPLPSIPRIDYPLALVHDKVTFYKGTHHQLSVEEMIPRKRINVGCAWIRLEAANVSVTFSYNRTCGGAPERTAYPRHVLNLALGTWGCIRYNGRFGWGAWTYKKTVLNIGHFENLTEDIFLTEPQRVFSDMADLW